MKNTNLNQPLLSVNDDFLKILVRLKCDNAVFAVQVVHFFNLMETIERKGVTIAQW